MSTIDCPYCAEEIREAAVKCRHCQTWLNNPNSPSHSLRVLKRSSLDRKISGICAGAANYLNLDPTIARVAYVLVTCATGIVPCVVAYAVLSFVIPSE